PVAVVVVAVGQVMLPAARRRAGRAREAQGGKPGGPGWEGDAAAVDTQRGALAVNREAGVANELAALSGRIGSARGVDVAPSLEGRDLGHVDDEVDIDAGLGDAQPA